MEVAGQGDHHRVDVGPLQDLPDPLEGLGPGPLGLLDDPRGRGARCFASASQTATTCAPSISRRPGAGSSPGSPGRSPRAGPAQPARAPSDPPLRQGPAGGGRAAQEPPAIQADRGHGGCSLGVDPGRSIGLGILTGHRLPQPGNRPGRMASDFRAIRAAPGSHLPATVGSERRSPECRGSVLCHLVGLVAQKMTAPVQQDASMSPTGPSTPGPRVPRGRHLPPRTATKWRCWRLTLTGSPRVEQTARPDSDRRRLEFGAIGSPRACLTSRHPQ